MPAAGYDLVTLTNPDSAMTDMVVYIDLSGLSAFFKLNWNTNANGYGRVFKENGVELASDWINLDFGAGTGALRFKYSGTLAAAGVQRVKIYPPNTGNIQYGDTAAYGRNEVYTDYEAYFPLEDLEDRTVNSHDLTNANAVSGAAKLQNGYAFNGANAVLTNDNPMISMTAASGFTIKFWAKQTLGAALPYMLSEGTDNDNYLGIACSVGGTAYFIIKVGGITCDVFSAGGAIPDDTWCMITAIKDGAAMKIFRDATELVDSNDYTEGNASFANGFAIGALQRAVLSSYWTGEIDDVSIINNAVSDDWVSYKYAMENDNATFIGTPVWVSVVQEIYGASVKQRIRRRKRLLCL